MLFPHIGSFLISSFYNICKKTADVRIAPYLLSLILPGIILRTQRLYDLPVAFYSIVLLAHCDQFMDRMSLPGKFLLVLSHNIPSAECRIIVKIIGLRQKYPACQLHLLQLKVKQLSVVCLKFNDSVKGKDLVIPLKKLLGSKSALCMTCFRPRI